jgi:hypothetical protein
MALLIYMACNIKHAQNAAREKDITSFMQRHAIAQGGDQIANSASGIVKGQPI